MQYNDSPFFYCRVHISLTFLLLVFLFLIGVLHTAMTLKTSRRDFSPDASLGVFALAVIDKTSFEIRPINRGGCYLLPGNMLRGTAVSANLKPPTTHRILRVCLLTNTPLRHLLRASSIIPPPCLIGLCRILLQRRHHQDLSLIHI